MIDQIKSKKQAPAELLFFPRKVVKMEPTGEDHLFFLQERTRNRATSLRVPTSYDLLGLTSGRRSAIILDKQGKYLRLKGVAKKIAERYPINFWGKCSMDEAYQEQRNALSVLKTSGGKVLAIVPAYLWRMYDEFTLYPSQFNFKDGKGLINLEQKKELLGVFSRGNPNYVVVPAYEITGDTRMDEALYELTKRKLSGKKQKERDELAKYLSFQSGRSFAELNRAGFSWYIGPGGTNSHLGNFVLDRDDKNIKIKLTDLLNLNKITRNKKYTDPEKEVDLGWVLEDMLAFQEDFQAECTTSPAANLVYRYFSDSLRKECFKNFVEGYASVKIRGVDIYTQSSKMKSQTMTEQEMRERINYVMTE